MDENRTMSMLQAIALIILLTPILLILYPIHWITQKVTA